jgi:glutamate 5-kinase
LPRLLQNFAGYSTDLERFLLSVKTTMKPILVIKFGTASITHASGEPNEEIIAEIARQVALLHAQYRIVLVSSGAVGAGKGFLKTYKGSLTERKAAAAIGNPLLLGLYARYFAQYGISIAQSLCERQHFGNRHQFLQLKETYEELWDNDIIPIANENDVVSSLELRFSDNDELATLIAVGFGASALLFNTSVGGLLDHQKQLVAHVPRIDASVLALADTSKSATGLGGMVSKLTFARLATRMGIRVVIFGMKKPEGILEALAGQAGTVFDAQESDFSARQRWLASGSLISGRLGLDAGAVRAIGQRKSLLAVGVRSLVGTFDAGEVIELCDEEGLAVGVARADISSEELVKKLQTQNFQVAHADNIVLL